MKRYVDKKLFDLSEEKKQNLIAYCGEIQMERMDFAMEKGKSKPQNKTKSDIPPPPSALQSIVNSRPSFKPKQDKKVIEGAKSGDNKEIKKEKGVKQPEKKRETQQPLPPEIMSAFPDADLKDVKVIRESQEAEESGVSAFTEGNVIKIAPGEYSDEVLRHEVAHVVQQKKGKEGKGGNEGDHEKEAEGVEKGGKVETSKLSPAKSKKRQNKTKGAYRNNSKKQTQGISELPKVSFDYKGGKIVIDKISGSHDIKSTGIYWPGGKCGNDKDTWFKLFRWNQFWPIPAFPVAGVNVELDASVRAGLDLTGSVEYAASHDSDTNEWTTSLTGKVTASAYAEVAATLTGGLEANVVLQRGGVGVFARAGATIKFELNGALEGSLNLTKRSGALKGSLDGVLGGDIKGVLGVCCWTRGWFADKYKEWSLAEFPIAYFEGAKFKLAAQLIGPGGFKMETAGFTGPTVGLGKAPELK